MCDGRVSAVDVEPMSHSRGTNTDVAVGVDADSFAGRAVEPEPVAAELNVCCGGMVTQVVSTAGR